MIDLRFEPSKQDYIRVVRAKLMISFKQPWGWMIPSVVVVLCFGQVVLSFSGGDVQRGMTFLIGMFLVGGFLFAVLRIVISARIGNQVQQGGERTLGEVHWQFNDEQILIENKFAEAKFDWGTFQEIIEVKDYYLLVHTTNKNMVHSIPKRVFESPEQEAAFCELAQRNIEPQNKSAEIHNKISIFLVIVFGFFVFVFSCLAFIFRYFGGL